MPSQFLLDRYREHLERLVAGTDPLAEAIREAGSARSWWDSDLRWARIYGRIDPGKSPYCTFVYETRDEPQRLCLVELFESRPAQGAERELHLPDAVFGWLRVIPFPWDPRLTTLSEVMSGLEKARVLRYRPYKRCTLHVEEAGTGGGRFVKVFSDDKGAAIHRGSVALWKAASRGELGFDVAEPDRWDAATRTLWQGCVRGSPVMATLCSDDGPELAERMGRACASIVRSSVRPTLTFDANVQIDRTTRYARYVCKRAPALAPQIDAFLADLAELHRTAQHRPPRPIHGAPHAHQWLDTGSRLGLIDFDRFSFGDPELDVATFVGEMDFESSTRVPVESLNQAFVTGYESVAGPLDGRLLRAYRAHKRFAKVYRTMRAVRVNGAEQAARHLRRARECLKSELP